jgi:hypothetical protein
VQSHAPRYRAAGQAAGQSQQHANTKAQLETRGHQVDSQTWRWDVWGTIHLEIKGTVTALGITQPRGLLLKIHIHTVEALHTIVQARRCLEKAASPRLPGRLRGHEQQWPP